MSAATNPSEPTLVQELPQGVSASAPRWGSDVVAEVLRDLGLEFIALNPGSSYRGLHDSLVNHLGNRAPQMLLCLHEEHAVAMAHGYAKVADRPMAVALHSNVGLMHASMALFNAYCDRVPMLVLGATGPLDAAQRRPWIDWLHTATDQAALVRPFLKWDDQPMSAAAAAEALMQAARLTQSSPKAPTYVCLDTSVQEREVDSGTALATRPVHRFVPALAPAPDPAVIAQVADAVLRADSIVLLVGRTTREPTAWERRLELAERLDAQVFTHHKLPAAFPTEHPLHAGPPRDGASGELHQALRSADLIIALEWLDLGGTLALAGEVRGLIVSVSMDTHLHSGWGKESLTPVPADIHIDAGVDATVGALLERVPHATGNPSPSRPASPSSSWDSTNGSSPQPGSALTIDDVAVALAQALSDVDTCLVRVPLSWNPGLWPIRHPLDVLGGDGGEGVGSGPGMTIGAALALRDSNRLAVAVLGDGDFAMGVNALWTAAHYELPLIIVVANNRSFFNDEIHQHRVAVARGRPTENRWIGQRIQGPDIDHAALARGQGLVAHGPVADRGALADALASAVADAQNGGAVVVDARIASEVAADSGRLAGRVQRG